MKIRQGFVSNSSTTSFCIYGVCFERDEVIENLKELKINDPVLFQKGIDNLAKKDYYADDVKFFKKLGVKSGKKSEEDDENISVEDSLKKTYGLNEEDEEEFDEDEYDLDISMLFEDMFPELELENHYGQGGELYVGRSWSSIKDDETGKQFKDSIEASLKKILGNDIECGHHEEAFRDG